MEAGMHRKRIDALSVFNESRLKRNFLDFLKKKDSGGKVRPGALTPKELRELIKSIGNKKKVNITRVEYDGTPEDKPVTVQIVDIRDEYFTGKVINLERSIKQEMDEKLVFVKGGGGTIDFYYKDGDIKRVEQDIDESIIEQKNQDVLLEILDALDLEESILISFYDRNKGGVMNGTGRLLSKDVENKTFKVELNLINDIELDSPKTFDFDLEKDTILDLEVVI
jgi:hypothetical protein